MMGYVYFANRWHVFNSTKTNSFALEKKAHLLREFILFLDMIDRLDDKNSIYNDL